VPHALPTHHTITEANLEVIEEQAKSSDHAEINPPGLSPSRIPAKEEAKGGGEGGGAAGEAFASPLAWWKGVSTYVSKAISSVIISGSGQKVKRGGGEGEGAEGRRLEGISESGEGHTKKRQRTTAANPKTTCSQLQPDNNGNTKWSTPGGNKAATATCLIMESSFPAAISSTNPSTATIGRSSSSNGSSSGISGSDSSINNSSSGSNNNKSSSSSSLLSSASRRELSRTMVGDELGYSAKKQYVLRRRGVIGDPEVVSERRGREGGREGGKRVGGWVGVKYRVEK